MSIPEPPKRSQYPWWRIPLLRFPGWFFGIRARIFLALSLLAGLLILALSLGIEHQARGEMERELTLRLQAVGETAISLVGPGVVPGLLGLSPAASNFPFYLDRRMALTQLKDRTGVRRVFLADTTGRSFVDTDPRIGIGTPLPQLRSDRFEMREVRSGRPAAADLFTDEQGQMRKTGYVPIVQGGRVQALIGVEADATFLRAIRTLRLRILLIGAAGIVAAFVLAAPVARGLTRPLRQIVAWARHLGAGDFSRPVPVTGRDEIAFLGRTLEQMRVQLEERDREQRAMVAGVAHELRNPLGGIRLYAELLSGDSGLSDGARRRLEKILKELDHLGVIVDEFLLYARPGAPALQPVALFQVVEELAEWIRPQAETREVQLFTDGSSESGRSPVQADPTQVRQILRNLIQNGIDASPAGGAVWIRTEADDACVTLTIEDEGPGCDPSLRQQIFEPFYTTKATGAGLGLAIVRRLVLLNHAEVEVDDRPGGGARFRVRFRRAEGAGRFHAADPGGGRPADLAGGDSGDPGAPARGD
jgi:signal transduction histidine kinase